jgi:hypothetical protein
MHFKRIFFLPFGQNFSFYSLAVFFETFGGHLRNNKQKIRPEAEAETKFSFIWKPSQPIFRLSDFGSF